MIKNSQNQASEFVKNPQFSVVLNNDEFDKYPLESTDKFGHSRYGYIIEASLNEEQQRCCSVINGYNIVWLDRKVNDNGLVQFGFKPYTKPDGTKCQTATKKFFNVKCELSEEDLLNKANIEIDRINKLHISDDMKQRMIENVLKKYKLL